jgi:hypothetical protein
MHDLRPLTLQFLDDFHARHQALLAVFEVLNVGDLGIQLHNLFFQKIVLGVLSIDPARVQQLAAEHEYHGGERRSAQTDHEFAAPFFAFLFAMGK